METAITIVGTIRTAEPHKAATYFSAILAADKGVPSEIREGPEPESWLVVDDRGQAVLFAPEEERT